MKFSKSLQVDCSREQVFDLTQDYPHRLEWDPFLSDARLLDAAPTPQIGVKAVCVDHRGFSMEVVYVAYKRPEVAAVKMTRGPFFLSSFAGHMAIQRDRDRAHFGAVRVLLSARVAMGDFATVCRCSFRPRNRTTTRSAGLFRQGTKANSSVELILKA